MRDRLRAFLGNADGAVSADWVKLTAGVMFAVIAGMALIRGKAIDAILTMFTWVDQIQL